MKIVKLGLVAGTVAGLLGVGSATAAGALAELAPGSVSATAATWTPSLATSGTDGSVEQIRALAACGGNIYAVGRFSDIRHRSGVSTRYNAFSFSATTGALTSWAPRVNGQVNGVALSADCSTAYLGGSFTAIGTQSATSIAAVSVATGTLASGFRAPTLVGPVNTLARVGTHLLVGGRFSITGSTKKHLVSLNTTTGADDGYVNLPITGKYDYTQQDGRVAGGNSTQVFNTELSPDGSKLLAMGVFTSFGGQARRQIVMLDLGATSVTVNPWYSAEFDQNCHAVQPFYVRAASWAPDLSKVYVATTGYKPATGTGFNTWEPRGGLCDATVAFPATASSRQVHDWINYTGCDSLYSVASDAVGVYAGGHQRWADSPVQCDGNGNGTKVVSPGLSGLHALTGTSILDGKGPNSAGDLVNKYSRGRGVGAVDMLLTSAGLWIASDNAQNSDSCGKTSTGTPARGRAGLCFLPY